MNADENYNLMCGEFNSHIGEQGEIEGFDHHIDDAIGMVDGTEENILEVLEAAGIKTT